jgi:hypothetical protein
MYGRELLDRMDLAGRVGTNNSSGINHRENLSTTSDDRDWKISNAK